MFIILFQIVESKIGAGLVMSEAAERPKYHKMKIFSLLTMIIQIQILWV